MDLASFNLGAASLPPNPLYDQIGKQEKRKQEKRKQEKRKQETRKKENY
jgi:hypothetical protein